MKLKVGDIVRSSDLGYDILFKVQKIVKGSNGQYLARLSGVDMRLLIEASIDSLENVGAYEFDNFAANQKRQVEDIVGDVLAERKKVYHNDLWRGDPHCDFADREAGLNNQFYYPEEFFDVPGKVLHLDGDKEYLAKCMMAYERLKVPVDGFAVNEGEQPGVIEYYLAKYQPNILVITGHDNLRPDSDPKDINNYRNSKYFQQTVKAARRYCPGSDGLVIFAGACQSHYEALLEAGANFASSPRRRFIHIFDPVFIVESIAYTSIKETLSLNDVLSHTVTGTGGVGGVETRGCFRLGFPRSLF